MDVGRELGHATALAKEMVARVMTGRGTEALGLSAVQVGVLKRLVVVSLFDAPGTRMGAKEAEELNAKMPAVGWVPENVAMGTPPRRLVAMLNPVVESASPVFTTQRAIDDAVAELRARAAAQPHTANARAQPRSAASRLSLRDMDAEACLSLPGQVLTVPRPLRCTIRFQTLLGTTLALNLEGFQARVALHELDHLDGVLISDRHLDLSPLVDLGHRPSRELREYVEEAKRDLDSRHSSLSSSS